MIFSSDTIKSAIKRRADYNSNNTNIVREYVDEPFEPFTSSAIEEGTWNAKLDSMISNYRDIIPGKLALMADNINKRFYCDYKQFFDPGCIDKVNRAIINSSTFDLSKALDTIYLLHRKYCPETYLINAKHQLMDIKKYIDTVNDLLKLDKNAELELYIKSQYIVDNDDYILNDEPDDFLEEYHDSNIISRASLMSMNIIESPNAARVLINNSAYITDYLNDLATSLRDLPSFNFSENHSALIRSKIISVVSYKIKLIDKILRKLSAYTDSYVLAMDYTTKQDIVIFNYLLNPDRKFVLDASITNPQDDIEETAFFNTLYSAYKEACENNAELNSLTESVGLMALDEASNANIMKYINKVTTGIAKAWNTFKAKMEDLRKKAVGKFTNKFKQNAENLPDDLQFEVQNMPELDESKFNLLKVIPFNYEEMKDNLKSSDTFIAKYYPGLNKNEGESLKESMERFLTKSKSNIKVTKDYILNTVIPILEKGNTVAEQSVETDVNTTNASTKAISLLSNNNNVSKISTTTSTTTTTNNTNGGGNATNVNASGDINAIIGEADGEGVKIVDDPNRTAAVDNRSILKDISVYLSVSSTVLSTKMKLIRQKELTAFRILAHAFAPPKKNKEEQK